MFYNFGGVYIQNCCGKNPKNTRGRCRCNKLTSPTVQFFRFERWTENRFSNRSSLILTWRSSRTCCVWLVSALSRRSCIPLQYRGSKRTTHGTGTSCPCKTKYRKYWYFYAAKSFTETKDGLCSLRSRGQTRGPVTKFIKIKMKLKYIAIISI